MTRIVEPTMTAPEMVQKFAAWVEAFLIVNGRSPNGLDVSREDKEAMMATLFADGTPAWMGVIDLRPWAAAERSPDERRRALEALLLQRGVTEGHQQSKGHDPGAEYRKHATDQAVIDQAVIDHYQTIADDPTRPDSKRAHARDFVEHSIASDAPTAHAIMSAAWTKANDPTLTDEQRASMLSMLAKGRKRLVTNTMGVGEMLLAFVAWESGYQAFNARYPTILDVHPDDIETMKRTSVGDGWGSVWDQVVEHCPWAARTDVTEGTHDVLASIGDITVAQAWRSACDPTLTEGQRSAYVGLMTAAVLFPTAMQRRQPLPVRQPLAPRERLIADVFAASLIIIGDDIPDTEVLQPYIDQFLATLESAYTIGAEAILMLATDDQGIREPLDQHRTVIPPAFAIVPAGQRTLIHPSRLHRLSPIDGLNPKEARNTLTPAFHWALTAMFAAQDGPTHGQIPASWTCTWLSPS